MNTTGRLEVSRSLDKGTRSCILERANPEQSGGAKPRSHHLFVGLVGRYPAVGGANRWWEAELPNGSPAFYFSSN